MTLALASRRTALTPPWVRNDLWRRARAVPSLDLRFADNKSLVDAVTGASLITFTRASSGTFVNSAGVLQTAATDVPRFDHNPITGESLGLLVEEQRTNSIRNNTMVGAVAGTPGTLPTNWANNAAAGVTFSVIGTGTENGITYIDLRATAVSAPSEISYRFELNTQTTAASGQSWTASTYLKVQAGSLSNITTVAQRVREFNSGGTQVQVTTQDLVVDGILRRFATTRTLSDATTTTVNSLVALSCTAGQAIDITLRIGLPQLEQGAFATSVILTSTAAVTRNADLASITGSAFSGWYRQDEGSFFCSTFAPKGVVVYGTGDTFDNAQYVAVGSSSNVNIRSGAALVAILTAPVSTTTVTNIAHGYAADNFAAVSNGGAIATDTSGAVPLAQVRLKLGSSAWDTSGGNNINGHIRRLTFWGQRLPNNILQGITQ